MYEVDPIEGLYDLPNDVLAGLAELRAALELSPHSVGRPWVRTNPTGMRVAEFVSGRAFLVFGVLEQEGRVAIYDLIVY